MTERSDHDPRHERLDRGFLAIILIFFGVASLVVNNNWVTLGENVALLFVPLLGVALLAWGLFSWRYGPTVPGCIITGLGVAIYLTESQPRLSGEAEGGWIVLGLAAGFAAITVMNVLFKQKNLWWPLIPAIILGVVGTLLVIGTREAQDVLDLIGRYWPVLLIVIGLWVLFGRREQART